MAFDLSKDIVLRWEDRDPALAPVLRQGGVDVVLASAPDPAFTVAAKAVGLRVAKLSELTIGDLTEFKKASGAAALSEGLWPGVASGFRAFDEEAEIASPSRQPWVDANGFRIDSLRALCPGKMPALAYLPNAAAGVKPTQIVRRDSLELALIETWLHGGNYVLALEPRYKAALVASDPKALAAWRQQGATVNWLKRHRALLGRPVFTQITLLVDGSEATTELANLIARHSASPSIENVEAAPAPDPEHRLVLVAASLAGPSAAARDRILAHADAGAIVVTDRGEAEPWWRVKGVELVRDEEDRETFRLGRGKLVAYKATIMDPNDFALDVIDLATQARRAVRIWDALAVVASVTQGPEQGPIKGRAVLRTINYGDPMHWDLMAYVQGNYQSAVLLRPEAPPLRLKASRRGASTEVILPDLRRVGLVVFD